MEFRFVLMIAWYQFYINIVYQISIKIILLQKLSVKWNLCIVLLQNDAI